VETHDPGDYRPISVAPIVAKVLEKVTAFQLNLFLENCKLLHNLWGAYRHGRSADQILLYAVDTILQVVDHGDYICAAFLDLRKAFDSLDHHLLSEHLSGLGVTGVELQWFVDYLSNHKQHVKKGNQYSEWGAVLGVSLRAVPLGPCFS